MTFLTKLPKSQWGLVKSSDLRDAEDFDVIGEVERKAETVKQNALEKENNKEPRVNRPINGQRKRFLPM